MWTPRLTNEDVARYHEDGFLFVENFLDEEQTDLLAKIARADREMSQRAGVMKDARGGQSKLKLDWQLKDDVYSAHARSARVVECVEQLIGGEVRHFHHKMMLKEPRVGGAWEWHQDYGYWYHDGFLWPDMISCMIAVDRASRANGCLQVLRGSHCLGRIEHGEYGQQTGADPDRVAEIAKRLELLYCEMEPGTALFFHCNTLHRSDPNESDDPRWALICCYTAGWNVSFKAKEAERTAGQKIDPFSDQQVYQAACRQWEGLEEEATGW